MRWRCLFPAVIVAIIANPAAADMIGHGGLIRSIDVSQDGAQVLTASFDYSARLWRFDDQSPLRSFDQHDGPVNGGLLVPAKRRAVTVGADGRFIVWNTDTGAPVHVRDAHRGRAMAVALSPDGETALTGGWDGRLALWNIDDGRLLAEFDVKIPLVSVAFGQHGAVLIAGGRDGSVSVLRRVDGVSVARFQAHDIGLTQLSVSADGSRLLTIGLDNKAKVWRQPDFEQVIEYLPEPETKPLASAMSRDGTAMLVGYLDGTLLHLDTATGMVRRSLRVENGPVWSVAFSSDSRFALTAGVSERVMVWHLETGDRIDANSTEDLQRPMPWLTSDHPGARVYRKCAECHALTRDEPQRSGPHFTGLFGRRAGSVAGYRYSEALRQSTVIWSPDTLAELFRRGPNHYLPGTKMPVQKITDEKSLASLIDYLRSIAPPN
jgi:cytochrome c